MSLMTYLDAINSALREEMARDERVFMIGEDVGSMGGVFKATKGLQEQFAVDRVIDSPLAEGPQRRKLNLWQARTRLPPFIRKTRA